MQGAGGQQLLLPIGENIASVGCRDMAYGIAQKIDHHFSIVAQLDAKPVPAATAERDEIAPLLIHPRFARYCERLAAIDECSTQRHTGTRIVIREATYAKVNKPVAV